MGLAIIHGFSTFSKAEKIDAIAHQLDFPDLPAILERYWHVTDQPCFDQFSENTVSNYFLPFGLAPNFVINGKVFHMPMVTEESSVVAAASAAAKFWANHGGFHAAVIDIQKTGHVYFRYAGLKEVLYNHWSLIHQHLLAGIEPDMISMVNRGGGLVHLLLEEMMHLPGIYALEVSLNTVDAMGANFINSLLEHLGSLLDDYVHKQLPGNEDFEIIMAILSNYTPDCIVRCSVSAPVSAFDDFHPEKNGKKVAEKILTAVKIAENEVSRAVTHNKGIMNGADAVVIATGNDFRAVEAGAHAYAARHGRYTSLSTCFIHDDIFHLTVELPMAVGTVGGLTQLHPIAKCSLDILQSPTAQQLMMMIAAAGLACHFSALRALVTKGIQQGHMKMHLPNILAQLGATQEQKIKAILWFADKNVSFNAVREFLNVT